MENYYKITILIILILFAFMIPSVPVMGDWESLYFFHNFAPLNYFIDFKISPRANIGNPGYSFQEISRYLIETFQLNLNINSYRIPSKIYGIITLFLFFIISKRFVGNIPSLISTLLLATNINFIIFQNSMTIVIASALGMLFLIERLLKIDSDYKNLFTWFSLALPLVFISFNYGLVRIYATLILFFWFIKFYTIKQHMFNKLPKIEIVKKFVVTLILVFIILIVLNKDNFHSLISAPTFIVPFNSETFLMSKIKTDEQVLSLFNTLTINTKILFYSVLGLPGKYSDSISVNQIIGYRHPIISTLISLLFFYGFIKCIINVIKKFDNSYKYIFLLIFLIICFFPILTSTIFVDNEIYSITLSNYRIFFLIFPIYLIVAISINEIIKKFDKNYKVKYSFFFIFTLLIFNNILTIKNSIQDFKDKILSAEKKFDILSPNSFWINNTNYTHINKNFTHHYDHQIQYIKIAKLIEKRINQNNLDQNLIIKIDKNIFEINEIKNFHYLNGYDFNTFYLSFFMNNTGLNTAWIQNMSSSTNINKIGFNKNKIFPVLKLDKKLKKIDIDQNNKIFLIRYHNKKLPKFILANNTRQEEFASEYFLNKNIPFKTIQIN